MISAARILGLAATAALLLGLGATATPASAQAACKDERIRAKSEIRVRGETFAANEAKERWEKAAQERFGRSYGKWSNAKDANVECESAKSPRVGLPAKVCTAYGRPCQRDDKAAIVEEREADKGGKRSEAGNRDRERYRDRFGIREDWYARRLRRAYDAEMRHQDYLAKRRRQLEKWAERREAAYWRSLYRRQSHGYWD